jgi:hypothetical protein
MRKERVTTEIHRTGNSRGVPILNIHHLFLVKKKKYINILDQNKILMITNIFYKGEWNEYPYREQGYRSIKGTAL